MGHDEMDHEDRPKSNFHRFASVMLRLAQLAAACIVLGILCRFCYLISIAGVNADGRIIYAMVVAGIAIIYSILFIVPAHALFTAFPMDFVLFAMWLVAFCLLETKTGTSGCNARWFNSYWGFYWGRFWYTGAPPGTISVNHAGCAQWRTVLAFSFMACIAHLLSGFLGVYVFHNYTHIRETKAGIEKQVARVTGRRPQESHSDHVPDMENGQVQTAPPLTTTAPNPSTAV